MKKIIYILYFLLFILILTCIYQKSSSLSEKNTSIHTSKVSLSQDQDSEEKTTIIQKNIVVPKLPEKINTIKEVKPQEIQKQATHSTQKLPTKSIVETIDSPITKVSIVKATVIKDRKKPIVMIIKEVHVPNIKKIKKDITDDFLSALSNRNIALKNRDLLESQLQTLINKALEQRIIAIEHSNKILFKAQERQKEIVEERDNLSQKIIENRGNK